ncbi:MAG TPA: GntR family transcriptional regulator [Gaiellaceae bacterium]|nr:GntR family transcriptional regulator [Gaiellaceae bacterium]
MTTDSTKADEIALEVEREIVTGELAPGTVLRQEHLSERFAVSRTPVREALRQLAARGLVSFEPNRGVRVRTLSHQELYEAFLVRAELESLATGLAAPKMTPADLDELEAAERRFADLTSQLLRPGGEDRGTLTHSWVQANHGFHDVIYRVAEVPMVERIAKSARRTFSGHAVWGTGGSGIDELYEDNVRQHQAIIEALRAKSAAAARLLAREHVLASFHLLETVLDQVGTPPPPRRLRRSA